MKSKYILNSLENTVIAGGYCVGCGACASTNAPSFSMQMNEFGMYNPRKFVSDTNSITEGLDVCPFSEHQLSENDIFPKTLKINSDYHQKIGFYHGIYAGYVATNKYRKSASSDDFISRLAAAAP